MYAVAWAGIFFITLEKRLRLLVVPVELGGPGACRNSDDSGVGKAIVNTRLLHAVASPPPDIGGTHESHRIACTRSHEGTEHVETCRR